MRKIAVEGESVLTAADSILIGIYSPAHARHLLRQLPPAFFILGRWPVYVLLIIKTRRISLFRIAVVHTDSMTIVVSTALNLWKQAYYQILTRDWALTNCPFPLHSSVEIDHVRF